MRPNQRPGHAAAPVLLAFVCLLSVGYAISLAPRESLTSNSCSFEDAPEGLPSNLSSIAYLGLNGEFHLHGEFFANFSNHEHYTFFTLTSESYLRISVAPQEDWDVDLFLYSQTARQPIASAVSFYGEEMIARVLPPGDYRVRFNFLIFSTISLEQAGVKCKTLTLEWAIVPKPTAKERASKYSCGAKEVLPELPNPLVVKGEYSFAPNQTFNVQTTQASTGSNNIRMVKGFNVSIPATPGKVQMWRLDATLGYDFLTGGSLGLLLDLNASTLETDLACVSRTGGLLHPNADECVVAVDARINEAVISWIVEPGEYTIWLYDLYNQTDKSVLGCAPFTFTLNVTPFAFRENLLNCKATRLPQNLNVPGLLGDRGVLEYAENVWLDYENPDNNINFTLTTTSNLRIYVEEHRVDIDIRLSNASGYLAQSISFNHEESIIITLAPGNYKLNVKYFDARKPQFCDTFFMMIAIAPVSLVPPNMCSAQGLPSAPTLPDTTAFGGVVTVPRATYLYPRTTQSMTQIFSRSIVATTAVLRVVVGVDFLLGDVKLVVSWNDTGNGASQQREMIGTHAHGMVYVSTQVPATTINITLYTGYVTKTNLNLPSFPNCLKYTFQLDYFPLESPEAQNFCSDYVSLPHALNTTQELRLKEVHLSDRFLIPVKNGAGGLVTEKTKFTVDEDSQFRLFCEAPDVDSNIDVDFHLQEDGQIVASAINTKQEEEITYSLRPGHSYELVTYFFLPFTGTLPPCSSYSVELSIAPTSTKAASTCVGQPDHFPPDNLIPSPPGKYFEVSQTYSFTQRERPTKYKLNFTLDQPYFLRAVVAYDFVWNNLNLRLHYVAPSGVRSLVAYSKTAYNRNDIDIVQLVEGNYILEIYEPSLLNNPAVRDCVTYSLLVALLPVAPSPDSPAMSRCMEWPMPLSLNTLAGLGAFTDPALHWQRDVLADVTTKEEITSFTLEAQSVFRVYVPHHERLDVDLYLYSGSPGGSGGTPLGHQAGFSEESIAYKLQAGPYYFKAKFYPQRQISLPSVSSCPAFPLEMAIAPLLSLTSNPRVGQACAANVPLPTALVPNQATRSTYSYTRTAKRLEHRIEFNVTGTNGRLELDLYYDFVTSSMSAQLTRRQSATTSGQVFHSRIGTNHAFLYVALVPGNYELLIHDPVSDFKIDELKCLTFEMAYTLTTDAGSGGGGGGGGDSGCDSSQLLPANLDRLEGGSVPFGGPQAADGEIKIYADHILMPKDRFAVQRIEFVNPVDSFIRLFAHSDNTNNDIDFALYSNVNKTIGSLLGFSNAMEAIESALFFLPGSPKRHLLEVTYFRVDQTQKCNYFHFELAAKPHAKVMQDLLCPIFTNTPPADLTFAMGNNVDVHRDDYVFTAALINSTAQTFKYTTQLNVRDRTSFSAEIGFNFLANDFRLRLRDSNNVVQFRSKVRGAANRNSYINFYHDLRAMLEPGTYYLDIVEDLLKTELRVNSTMCHRFSLAISGVSELTPHVVSVTPAEGHDLDPSKDLTVRIAFSDPIATPRDVVAYLAAHPYPDNAPGLALRHISSGRPSPSNPRSSEWDWIRPSLVRLDSSRRTLEVVFPHSSFSIDGVFELVFNLTEFTTGNGTHFANSAQAGRVYSLVSVNCSDHGKGSTAANGTLVCTCDEGYAGVNCDACASGYHPAGDQCVKNMGCTTSFCNGHGFCSDTLGYPVCTCFSGYATVGTNSCSICAQGYAGYPSCQPIPEGADSDSRCSAQLLPRHLDTVAHLGYNNEVRLQGYFYIDVSHGEHNMYFKLQEDSVFRLYAAPHWVDIDLWLYRVGKSKTEQVANGGLSIGREESLFLTLNKSVGSDSYLLRFKYFVFSSSLPACETVNIDLAIAPLSRVERRVSAKRSECSRTLSNAALALPLADRQVIRVSADDSYNGFTYKPNTKFAVAASGAPPETRPFVDRGYYFWNKTISVNAVPPNHVAILRVEVGYSFLESDFALLLELPTKGKPTHCSGGDGVVADKTCVSGFNTYNKHILETVIRPNSYTLWLYQPERIFSDCALFEFSLSVRFELEDSKTFACEGPTLPPSLNGVNYINNATGYLHLAEAYVVDFVQYSFFEVRQPTYFKATAQPIGTWWGFAISLFSEENSEDFVIAEDTIFHLLTPGNYSFFVSAFSLEDDGVCPEVHLELEMMTQQMWNARMAEQGANDPCPFPATSVLPVLPSPMTGTEYTYPAGPALYAFNTGEMASYLIDVSTKVRLIASTQSNFLFDDVRLELRTESGTAVVKSIADYNRAFLDRTFGPGRFTLAITRPSFPSPAPNRPYACSPFDFELRILPVTGSSARALRANPEAQEMTFTEMAHLKRQFDAGLMSEEQINEQVASASMTKRDSANATSVSACVSEAFEMLPVTLNSKRFLYSDPVVNYQSDNFLVPIGQSILLNHEMYITVTEDTILRVYTEFFKDVDIDMKLYRANQSSDVYEQVASASNGIYNEEVIVAKLVPRIPERPGSGPDPSSVPVRYKLKFMFWKWNMAAVPRCATFNMELALTPISMIGAGGAVCPIGGGDKWPAKFPDNMPAKAYHYDSTDPAGLHDGAVELLYFTQTATAPKNHTYTFQLGPEMTDLHIEVGYNFGLGDMALLLVHKTSGERYRGVNGYNRNYVTQADLLPGPYELTLYETAVNHQDYLKCAYFTFEVHIVQAGRGQVSDPTQPVLPAVLDLNTVPYLYYEGYTHFQGDFVLFEANDGPEATKEITFRVDEASALRVGSHPSTANFGEEDISFKLSRAFAPLSVDSGSLYYPDLVPGTNYTLSVIRTNDASAGQIKQSLELAVEPLSFLDDYADKVSSQKCNPYGRTDEIQISPDRLYTFHRHNVTIDSRHVNVHKNESDIASFKFSVAVRSAVVARVGFQYTLNELRLVLKSLSNPTGDDVSFVVHSRPYKNFNELDFVVEPGRYALVVQLIRPSAVWTKMASKGHRCVPYSISVTIDDATRGGVHTDCSQYATLPYDLSRPDGGSAPFGGPMRDGYLHISGDRFLASGLDRASQAIDTMQLTLDTKSMISLITATDDNVGFQIQYRLYNKLSRSFVEPVHASHTAHERTELFIVDVRESTSFELRIQYDKILFGNLPACPVFDMDLIIDRYTHVIDSVQCPTLAGLATSPKQALHVGASGESTTDFVSTNMSTAFIRSHMVNGHFVYPINITVDGPAYLSASIGYYSLTNGFTTVLRRAGSNTTIGLSSYALVAQHSGQTNVVRHLTGLLRKGEYELTIKQPRELDHANGRCYPFVWDVLLRSSDVTNIVESVEPASGSQLNPQKELDILVTFSERPFKDGKAIELNNPTPIKQAFFLLGVKSGSETPVQPTYAEPRSADGTSWLLVFAAGALKSGRTYNLALVPNALRDSRGNGVVISGREYTYSFISESCSGHGFYSDGYCICNYGYAGTDCEHCANGFNWDGHKCVENATNTNCKSDSCGCRTKDATGFCIEPLGECRDLTNGSIQCFCYEGFHATGARCEKCLPGYLNYPACIRREHCNPTCSVNAIRCDVESNRCICPANWAGPTCSVCAEGYEGSDCKPVSPNASGWNTFFKTFGILVGVLIGVSAFGWLVWWRYKLWRARRPRTYLPLGLEELEGAVELRGEGDDDGDDDAFADDPMFRHSSSSDAVGGRGGELVFEEHPDDDEDKQQEKRSSSSSTTTAVDDDFNPRGLEEGQSSAPSSPSLLDL